MRGIEAALQIYGEVSGKGVFAAEALRKVYTDISPSDRKLAATLLYCSLRRQGLWKHLLAQYSKRDVRGVAPVTHNALIVGIAGIVELKYFALPVLVNGIIQSIKAKGAENDAGFVNAILHTVANEAPKYLETLKKSSACAIRPFTGAYPPGPRRSGRRTARLRRPSVWSAPPE